MIISITDKIANYLKLCINKCINWLNNLIDIMIFISILFLTLITLIAPNFYVFIPLLFLQWWGEKRDNPSSTMCIILIPMLFLYYIHS